MDDFTAEQEYHRNKQRLHNLHCHGVGVLHGLEVSTATDGGLWNIVVEAGVAIDRAGNEVHLCTTTKFPFPKLVVSFQVGIRFSERPGGTVPVADDAEFRETMPAYVEEGCEVILETLRLSGGRLLTASADAICGDVLPLARVLKRGRSWRLDRKFKISRAR